MFENDEVKIKGDGCCMRLLSDDGNVPISESVHYLAPEVLQK